MSILGKIFGRIFPNARAAQNDRDAAAAAATQATSPENLGTQEASAPTSQPAPAATATMERVDVEKLLDGMSATKGQKLNWRTSIVDLMKLLDLDSSLQERKQLAQELGYSGDMGDSATMNMWLHKQVMRKLAENGGKVPADLKD